MGNVGDVLYGIKKGVMEELDPSTQLPKDSGVKIQFTTADSAEMAAPLVFLNSDMARFVSGELMIVDMGKNSEVVLGFTKSRLNVPVALKLYNTKFMQDMFKKQIS